LVFLLSELGLESIEVMEWLDALLDVPDDFVQHYAIVAVQHSGSLEHGPIVAKAVSKLGGERAVSLAALKLVALGSLRQVATAEDFLDDGVREAVIWLTGEHYDGWERFFAGEGAVALVVVAAAYRLREVDPAPLATATDDPRDESPMRRASSRGSSHSRPRGETSCTGSLAATDRRGSPTAEARSAGFALGVADAVSARKASSSGPSRC
jgi:hypothetical protein